MKRTLFISILFVCIAPKLLADTLPDLNTLLKGKNPSLSVRILDSLAEEYKSFAIDFSFRCTQRAFEICKQNNLVVPLAKTYRVRASLHRKNKNHDSVLIDLGAAEKIYVENKIMDELSGLYSFYGSYYYRLSDFKNASDYYFKSLEVAEKAGYTDGIAFAYNNIGNVFFHESNFEQAISYYKQALEHYRKTGNLKRVATSFDNIGLAYSNMNDLKTAILYQRQAITVLEGINDKQTLGEAYFNLGSTYTLLGYNDSARNSLRLAYNLDKEIKNDIGLTNIAFQLGILDYHEKNYKSARSFMLESFNLATEEELKVQMKDAAHYIARCYEFERDYENALKYQKINADLIGTIYNEENTKALKELSEKYQSEKKQKEIELLQKENLVKDANQKQLKTRNWALIGTSILILIIALIMYRRFMEKRKDNLLLEEKNSRITEQKLVIEEKNKSITDSIVYAQRIQFSVLPTEQQVKNVLPQSFVYYAPKDIISGDFYWGVKSGDLIYFAVADCTGHGVPGALMSMLGTSFLNQIVLEKGLRRTDEILKELHASVLNMLNEDMEHRISKDGMDIALLRIDKAAKEITFSGAGRPVYIVKDGQSQIIKGDKMSVGGVYSLDETKYEQHKIALTAGLKVYMFSDGIPDQFGGPKQKKLTVKKIQEWIYENHNNPMSVQKENFVTFINQWKGSVEQIDDMTFVGIEFTQSA